MTKLLSTLIVLFCIVLFASCGFQDKKNIEASFDLIKSQVSENGFSEEILKYLDQESNNYIHELIDYTNKGDYEAVAALGANHNCRLNSLMFYEFWNNLLTKDSSEIEEVNLTNVRFWMTTLGPGFFQLWGSERYLVKEEAYFENGKWILLVKSNLGDNKLFSVSKFIFSKEDEEWKLNLFSTMKFSENLLKQQLKRSRLQETDFLKKYLSTQSIDNSFYYKTQ